jgi:hypothetical protein
MKYFFAFITLCVLLLYDSLSSCRNSINNKGYASDSLEYALNVYRTQLDSFRIEFGGTYNLPDISFYLFGMGNREKYLYKNGELINCRSGETVFRHIFKSEMIVPNSYTVYGITNENEEVLIYEDEKGIWYIDHTGKLRIDKSDCQINIPQFENYKYSEILKVLHQEILTNIVDSKPLPNYFVYNNPWRRDAAMMAMCLELAGNHSLIKEWVLDLKEPYDKNNGVRQGNPKEEADNLGQTLYLLSLFTDSNHVAVKNIMNEIPKWQVEDRNVKYIKGRSDFQEVPVYQTKWLIYGLEKLGIDHNLSIPLIPDAYSSLFWWDFKEFHVKGDEWANEKYPYLGWARDHFYLEKNGLISNRDYPLTWETEASQADYEGMQIISQKYVDQKTAAPHTWHSSEVFLYLYNIK